MAIRGQAYLPINVIAIGCPTAQIHLDQKDLSSRANLRPDGTVMVNGALAMKIEMKASSNELAGAEGELLSKLFPAASNVFPRTSQCCLGIA